MKYTYYMYPGLVSSEICNRAIERFNKNNYEPGTISSNLENNYEGRINKSVRDTDRQWAPPFDVLECILTRVIQKANIEAQWNFNITDVDGAVQIGKYKINQHYSSHIDCFIEPDLQVQRKLSASLFLNDGTEYDGGELKILNLTIPVKTQGTIVVFPSFLAHEVKPVTRGERYSAVCWMNGPKWI